MGKLTLLNLGALANLAGTSLIAILATAFYVGNNAKSSQVLQAPAYSQFVHNEIMRTDEICFRDNHAPGMNAKMHYPRGTVDLDKKDNGIDYAFFQLPRDATKWNGKLEFIATDCEGNRSERKILYVLDGLIYESEPPARVDSQSLQPSTSQPSKNL